MWEKLEQTGEGQDAGMSMLMRGLSEDGGHEDEREPGYTVGMEPDFTSLWKPGRGQTRYFRPMFLNPLPTHKYGASS